MIDYMIALSTPTVAPSHDWDVAYASYDSKSFDYLSQTALAQWMFFSTDWTECYVIWNTEDDIFQYTLSTPRDASTASYSGKSLDISPKTSNLKQLHISGDWTKLYCYDFWSSIIHQYSLATAWDISTGTFVASGTFNQWWGFRSLCIKPDWTKVYVLCTTWADKIYQYSLSTAWDITTWSYDSVSLTVTWWWESSSVDFDISPDGHHLYTIWTQTDSVNQFYMSTAFDLANATYEKKFSVASEDVNISWLHFKDDWSWFFMVWYAGDKIYQYSIV